MKCILEVLSNHTQGDVSTLFVYDRFHIKTYPIINSLCKDIFFREKNLYFCIFISASV